MKILIVVLIACSAFYILRKDMCYAYYQTFVKQPNKMENSQYVVQFVGFKTHLSEADFLNRWTPFAAGFKKAGIKSIDLYKIRDNEELTFISRNIWDAKTYFQNFPTGVAGSGGGDGIAVTQFGGYWIAENALEKPNDVWILFTNEDFSESLVSRKRCTERMRFENQVEFAADSDSIPSNVFICSHLKTM